MMKFGTIRLLEMGYKEDQIYPFDGKEYVMWTRQMRTLYDG